MTTDERITEAIKQLENARTECVKYADYPAAAAIRDAMDVLKKRLSFYLPCGLTGRIEGQAVYLSRGEDNTEVWLDRESIKKLAERTLGGDHDA